MDFLGLNLDSQFKIYLQFSPIDGTAPGSSNDFITIYKEILVTFIKQEEDAKQ